MIIICKECGCEFDGRGNAKYCSKLCLGRNQYAANMFKPEWRLSKLLSMAKNRALNKQIPFDLDIEFLVSIWTGRCALSGIELDLGPSSVGLVHQYAPSIDRIVPELGYTKGNVRIVCYQINVALSEYGLEQFDKLVTLYINNKVIK